MRRRVLREEGLNLQMGPREEAQARRMVLREVELAHQTAQQEETEAR